jgi:hypothetical protein
MAPRFKAGQVVKFTYRDISMTDPNMRFKEVLVLHPSWQGKVHALDLKRMTPAEREVIFEIMNPENKGKPHRIPLVADILRRMDPVEDIKNPVSFYGKFVKPFLRTAGDVYRQYYPMKMSGVIVVKQTKVQGPVINPKPLFHGTETKAPQKPTAPTATKPKVSGQPAKKASSASPSKSSKPAPTAKSAEPAKKPMSRLDMIRAAAKKKK